MSDTCSIDILPESSGCACGASTARVGCGPTIELLGSLEAAEEPYPFVATRAKCVFVADAPR